MDDIKDSQSFEFYLELSKPKVYDSLIPRKELILVLAILYQREQRANHNNEINGAFIFSEEDIRDCLRQVIAIEQREQHQRYNQFIRDLQTHFLWRNEERGHYRLTEYARNFYRLMYDRLEQKFQPTYTERIFNKLIESLNSTLRQVDTEPDAFLHWVGHDFEAARIDISHQVEILYSRVDEAVQLLRDKVKPEADDFLTVLQHAEQNLDILTRDADELNHIFYASTTIHQYLDQLQHKLYAEEFTSRISQVSDFLADTAEKLHLVNQWC
jgi:replicative superfamily II helicase